MTDRERTLLVAQLMATRDTLLATVAQLDVSLLALGVDVATLDDPPKNADCPHPADQIVNHHTTLDDAPDDFECTACGTHSPTPFHPED